MITKQQLKAGQIYYYSDFYDKSYLTIRALKYKREVDKNGHFSFIAKIIDNSHYDGPKITHAVGTEHSFGNSFIYFSVEDMKQGSENYKKQQIRMIKKHSA